ncbi:lamin tail domain-containing protein [Floccifex sp.]|uniref:lamin tail domain-containing protein n=1 Tax=Floccifex sp. TaxID=2815810 RepID=UPI003F08D5D0
MNKKVMTCLLAGTLTSSVLPMMNVYAQENGVVINEIESNGDANDWVEVINTSNVPVDISGWYILDNEPDKHLSDTVPLPSGTILNPGQILVLNETVDFNFGLGKNDSVTLYDGNGNVMDSYAWNSHANGTFARIPDGTGAFVDTSATKGTNNQVIDTSVEKVTTLVINEVNSSPDDLVELMNIGTEALDISGFEIRDNSDDHSFKFKEGTIIQANSLLVVDAKSEGINGTFESAIGIGSGDSIRLFDDKGNLLDSISWTEHASYNGDPALASIGRFPDGTGAFTITKETKGYANDWYAPEGIVINEIESNGDTNDWVEIKNTSSQDIDISGWYILDNDPDKHSSDVNPLPMGTILKAGEYFVFEENNQFSFGLGKEDCVTLHASNGQVIDEYAWTNHANGVFARIPDGTGEFVDYETSTKGSINIKLNPVVLNEVQSKDPDGKDDWIELANPTSQPIDISGLIIKDSEDNHAYTIPEGTTIDANGYYVIYESEFGFGLGKDDSVRIYDGDTLIGSTTWQGHTTPSWGLYPNVNGNEYRSTKEPTPGEENKFSDIPDKEEWNGLENADIIDSESTFLEDSSGLDVRNGWIYGVDNGTGTFWIFKVNDDGNIEFAPGFENGKRVRFQKDANNPSAAGPDAEGITVDTDGMVFIASERDNSDKGTNYNTILMVNPNEDATDLIAQMEWNLTDSLPQVSANMGIEAVEWVSNSDINGLIIDQNTNQPYDSSMYPNSINNGIFFVALEDNGHVYAYVLNNDGSSVQIADIDSKLGGAMGLDYDEINKELWVAADNGYNNLCAKMKFNGTDDISITHVLPPAGLDTSANNEGFAISDVIKDGYRVVYHFTDGVKKNALTQTYLKQETSEQPENPGTTNPDEETPSTDKKDTTTSTSTNKKPNKKHTYTATETNVLSYMASFIVSIIGFIGCILFEKRQLKKK